MDQKLKSDFPIDWEEDGFVSRREFFKFLTLASGGIAFSSLGLAAWAKMSRKQRTFEPKLIALTEDLKPGTSILFDYPRPRDLCILIRRPNDTIVAYNQRCTHLSCPVQYQPEKDRLYCHCHNGVFSAADGSVLQGPPPRPLPEISLEIRGNEIWAVGIHQSEEAK